MCACLHTRTHSFDVGPIESSVARFHLRRGVGGGIAGGALWDAGTIVDHVLLAVRVLVQLLLSPAPVVKILAEGKGDAAPALVGVIVLGTAIHAVAVVAEASARHAMAGRVRPGATAQALVVAALVVFGAGSVFALDRAHCGQRDGKFRGVRSLNSSLASEFQFHFPRLPTTFLHNLSKSDIKEISYGRLSWSKVYSH